jgi:ADP-L-glycero-D-manno-heptose 6-epimerase
VKTKASRTLITGAAGFVGARYVELCRKSGRDVVSVDLASHFETRPEHQAVDFGQIVDREHLFSWLEKEKPVLSSVVHLGACTDTTQLDEAYLRRINTEYSQELWTYCSRARVPFVYASSAATYGDGALGYDDDESLIPKLVPLNPYGESKRLFDLWALTQEKRGESPPSWSGFKFFNVYGFGERHKNKMASVVLHAYDQILATGKVKLFKSHRPDYEHGHQKRDFILVDDVLDVLDFAATRPIRRGIFNLGTGRARTFLDLVQATFSAMGRPAQIEFIDTPMELRERYQYFTEAKMERLRAQDYSRPFTSIEDGVRRYVEQLRRT